MITWDPFRVPEERGEQVSALSRQKRKDKSKQICLEIAWLFVPIGAPADGAENKKQS